MRVLWVHNFDPNIVASGVFMHRLYEEMRSQGCDITEHYTGNLRNPLNMMRTAMHVRELSRQYDIVHAQFGSACGFVSSYARGPKVLTLRGTDLLGMDIGAPWHKVHGRMCRIFNRLSLPAYDDIIVMSNRMQRELVEHFNPSAKIHTIASGVDLNHIKPVPRAEARRKLGEGDNSVPWILFSSVCGDAHPIKRAYLAKATFNIVKEKCPDAQLILMTGKPHDEVPLWISASNVVLLTSLREGWPNIIKEALACNVPFVSTDVSNLSDIAEIEPTCAVTESTPEALASAVLKTLSRQDEPELRHHVAEMDVKSCAKKTLAVYEQVMENYRSH